MTQPNHAGALLERISQPKPFVCVCVCVCMVRLHSRVLKPQFQSTPINLKCKTIEGKDVLEQFSERHSGAYKSKHNVLQSTTVNLKSTKESVSEKV